MKQFTRMISLVVLAALLAACGGGGGGGGMSMTDAAKQFLEATFKQDKDKALAVVCAAYKTAAEATFSAGAAAAGAAEVDLSGVTFTVAKESGDTGEVAVSGKIKITVAGQSQEMDLAQMGTMTNLPMKNESGWKVCPVAP